MGFYGNILMNKLSAFFKSIKTDRGTAVPTQQEDTLTLKGAGGIVVSADATSNTITVDGSDFKEKQNALTKATNSTTKTVTAISQNENGEITEVVWQEISLPTFIVENGCLKIGGK